MKRIQITLKYPTDQCMTFTSAILHLENQVIAAWTADFSGTRVQRKTKFQRKSSQKNRLSLKGKRLKLNNKEKISKRWKEKTTLRIIKVIFIHDATFIAFP